MASSIGKFASNANAVLIEAAIRGAQLIGERGGAAAGMATAEHEG